MKAPITILSAFLVAFVTQAQESKLYKGAYANGYAEYNYIENDKLMRLWNGRFTYKDTLEIGGRGECDILLSGAYKNDQKSAVWVATIKGLDGASIETATGPMKDGMKIGLWTHRLTINDTDVKEAKASFTRDRFIAKFDYSYNPEEGSALGKYAQLNVNGSFDTKGMLDGEWKIQYQTNDGNSLEEVMRFQHGVLAFKVVRDMATGAEKERYDKEAFVSQYWSAIKLPDSTSTINEEKYGVLKNMIQHPVLIPLMKSWNEIRTVNVSNLSGSSLPTMLIDHGEVQSSKYLFCEQKIVPWKETPKGLIEWQEEQRILKEYNSHITKADKALEEKDFEESLRLYRLASTVIKDEAYPREQIPIVEMLIKDRATKNRLLASVREQSKALESTQKSMMKNETFIKKQDKLYEAYDIAYSADFRSMKSSNSKVMAFIENDNLDPITIPELETYEADLTALLQLQTKVNALLGKDTKDLEKELKKLESAKEIKKVLLR